MGTWMIRAGRGGVYAKSWVETGIVGIGWGFDGADIASMSHDQIRQAYAAAHPDYNNGKVGVASSQAAKFAHEIGKGATVVTYDPEDRAYHIGKVTGACVPADEIDGIAYKREVAWERTVSRDLLSPSSRNSLGSMTTIFSISEEVAADLNQAQAADTLASAGTPGGSVESADDDDEARFATYEDGIERIKDRVLSIDWAEMEELVAGLLRSMGYHASVTAKGPDGGRDVVAAPDALGLESPRIVAEVKHRKGSIGAPQIRSFIGGLRASDRGLYVSTGGFTKEARYEADRANVPVRLLDLDGFVKLYVESYDNADAETRSIIPLTRIWWPV